MYWSVYSPKALDPFDWRTPDETGIGNSETSHVEMCLRLAARGHSVTSYTPGVRDEQYGGVWWRGLEDATFHEPGIWVLYRTPETLDQFPADHPDQQIWLMFQDTHYDSTIPARAAKVDRALALCAGHRAFLADRFPGLREKLVTTSNGIRVDLIEAVEREGLPERCPHRLHFSSSPDRGLRILLSHIFPRAREIVTDLELHVYYGWNNIDKLMQTPDGRRYFGPTKAETERLLDQPGVVWRGRVGQRELAREWLKAGLWVFPSTYPETSCATAMEAQALGAIPIAHPLWGVQENVHWGTLITGGNPCTDPLTQARYVAEIVRLSDPSTQARIRPAMMADARARFTWKTVVRQWETWADVGEVVCS